MILVTRVKFLVSAKVANSTLSAKGTPRSAQPLAGWLVKYAVALMWIGGIDTNYDYE